MAKARKKIEIERREFGHARQDKASKARQDKAIDKRVAHRLDEGHRLRGGVGERSPELEPPRLGECLRVQEDSLSQRARVMYSSKHAHCSPTTFCSTSPPSYSFSPH